MTEELTYDTIPNEFWPKCFWCGKDLGDVTLAVNTRYNIRRICCECQSIVEAILLNMAPIMIGELLVKAGEQEGHGRFIEFGEIKDEAIQRMKEAQES